ncbi:hypothetical protein IKE72_01830 [Candidatus Saccharibacteria bacterium]|nr:hypothetical protein [Candidatus Saccharibacteria bacterium]
MKKELFLAVVTAIIGTLVGFFVVSIFAGSTDPFTITTLSPANGNSTETADYKNLESPNPEIFNYKSINPTVEVYVGDGSSTIITPEGSQDQNQGDQDQNDQNDQNNPEAN